MRYISSLILFMIFSLAYAQEKTPMISQDLNHMEEIIDVHTNPQGSYIAFIRKKPRTLLKDDDGKAWQELWLTARGKKEIPLMIGSVEITQIQWSNSGRWLYFLNTKFTKGKPDQSILYKVSTNDKKPIRVLEVKNNSIQKFQISPDEKHIALLIQDQPSKQDKTIKEYGFNAVVYEQNLAHQRLYTLEHKTYTQAIEIEPWLLTGHVSDFNWHPNSKQLLVRSQPTPLVDDLYTRSSWSIVDFDKQNVLQQIKTKGKVGIARYSYDGEYIAILHARDKNDPMEGGLSLVNRKNGKLISWVDNKNFHISDFAWSSNNYDLFFIKEKGTKTSILKTHPKKKEAKTILEFGPLIVKKIKIATDDNHIYIIANSAKHPNELFIINSKNPAPFRLTKSNPWLNQRLLAKQETIRLTTRDKVKLDGILMYPLNYKKNKKYPMLMVIHGGPEAHESDGWLTYYHRAGQIAAAEGMFVFYPNYRGSTGKGVKHSKLGQNDDAGKEFQDLVTFKKHLVKKGLVDSNRVGITGGSYGGYATAWAATKLTKEFAAGVMFVGISNQLSKFGTTDITQEMYLVHNQSFPWDKWQWYLKRSPIYYSSQSKTPLLILHGSQDSRVHPEQSLEMYRYLKVQNKDVRLIFYPNEKHGNKHSAAQYDYNLRMIRWFKNYLIDKKKAMPPYQIDYETMFREELQAKLKEQDKEKQVEAAQVF